VAAHDSNVQNGRFGCQFRNIASFFFTQPQRPSRNNALVRVTPITEAAGKMTTFIRSFLRDQTGATAIEYGLIAAGISVAIIATVQALGTSLNTTFTSDSTALK
jgi:pilus assembly protein Flp/PilA